jgi:YegS/Rv2252/BmrU family lipid kinase
VAVRALAIVNPAAGAGATARLWPALAAQLREHGLDLDVATTAGPRDGIALARRAVDEGRSLVVAVGGDGTVNEVVNGITGESGGPRATLGVIATGRGRDVCRNFGIPRPPAEAARALVSGIDVPVDAGEVELADGPRLFINAVGAGFDADVARRAQGRRGPGTLPYLVAVVEALASYAPRPVEITGDIRWSGLVTAVVVANGAYFGGGMKVAPAATVTDGVLDTVVLGAMGRLELLRWLPRIYPGTHVRHPRVGMLPARAVRIDAPGPLPVHVDGEPVGSTPVTVRVRARALRVRRPR